MRRLLVVAACVLALAGCGTTLTRATSAAPPAPTPAAAPAAISIPSLALAAPVDQVGLNRDGTVAAPDLAHPERTAWVTAGPRPGQQGRALIEGHINGSGHPGAFADLASIAVGAQVVVTDDDGTDHRFVVYRVGQAPKTAFPTGAVYGDVPGAELVLVTCGGDLDTAAHSYRDNTIVFARLA